ncbi:MULTISPECIES: Rieske (2Fe-2S) protein [Olivibacter]|jgi:nitrite reductase/ring-hydroxylating ferredoxin subunit|uniref:Rieske (2Fe-2S) protein n=2 Tax=Olivibacter TaxID=376469 RepID=A0ABV6HK81_9SPHI|nr:MULTISPECIES: Rieske (2Fe-2S) protein [Olivibacter]MCL4640956.1 Rieske (2Fe-2S) protein [Olivibacter sp. UJ_SKK_5.1]MDM8175333.1 Rieske (2Fe-2S) protein [Olivibacter sp. 47]QEL02096.1 Rieske (2Fe-2S) protein [Olivibacter sp. LS-1]
MLYWHKIGPDLLPAVNTIRKVRIGGKTICLIDYEQELFATSYKCPHAGADLSAGWCENKQIICPYHRHAFDLSNGHGAAGQGNYINVYALEKRGEDWYVGIKRNFFQRIFRG